MKRSPAGIIFAAPRIGSEVPVTFPDISIPLRPDLSGRFVTPGNTHSPGAAVARRSGNSRAGIR